MKCSFFLAMVVSILIYWCTTSTRTEIMEKKAWRQSWILWAILKKSWRHHPKKQQLYFHLLATRKTIQIRRTRHAGHCWRSRDELISGILLWTPSHGRAKAAPPARTYVQQLCADTACSLEDSPGAMDEIDGWRERIREICGGDAIRWWWYIWVKWNKNN